MVGTEMKCKIFNLPWTWFSGDLYKRINSQRGIQLAEEQVSNCKSNNYFYFWKAWKWILTLRQNTTWPRCATLPCFLWLSLTVIVKSWTLEFVCFWRQGKKIDFVVFLLFCHRLWTTLYRYAWHWSMSMIEKYFTGI